MIINDRLRSEAQAELRRREARSDLLTWCTLALEAEGFKPAAHHRLLIKKLAMVAVGKIRRLMVLMPPGSAKSKYASRLFVAWYLAQQSRLSVIAASHTSSLAESFSREVMAYVRDYGDVLAYNLATESVSDWSTTSGGQYRAVGVGGSVTGRRADLAVIDDPVKGRAEADSPIEREKVWSWYLSDLRTRLKPNAGVVLIQTRWHEEDLAGKLLAMQPGEWDVLSLPAVCEADGDPLGRKIGEFLWTDDGYGYGAELARLQNEYEISASMRDWQALFQQTPRPADGSIFKVHAISTLEAAPVAERTIRGWDLAATKDSGTKRGDWTCGVKLIKTKAGAFVITDVVRFKGGPDEVQAGILATAQKDGKEVPISLPQDPNGSAKAWTLHLVKELAGYNVSVTTEQGEKAGRAAPLASQVNVGNLSIVRSAAWNLAFLDELAAFPNGRHDDQVDAASRAFNHIAPTMKGAGIYELMRRQMDQYHAERGGKPTPFERTFAPGSVEYVKQQAALIPHRQQIEYIRNTAGKATLAAFHEDWDPVGEKIWAELYMTGMAFIDDGGKLRLTAAGIAACPPPQAEITNETV